MHQSVHSLQLTRAWLVLMMSQMSPAPAYPYRLQLILRYVNLHYTDPDVSLEAVAKSIDVTPSHVSRLLVQHTGEGLRDHLKRLRLQRGRSDLLTTTSSVKQISAGAGYKRTSDFCRHFRLAFGTTPMEYRATSLAQSLAEIDPAAPLSPQPRSR